MKPSRVKRLLLFLTGAIVALDVALNFDAIPGNTISQVVHEAAHRWTIIPHATGALIGHLFTSTRKRWWKKSPIALLVYLKVFLVFNWLGHFQHVNMTLSLFGGIVLGMIFWPQLSRRLEWPFG